MRVYISPSDQVRNTYSAGNTNEAVQCRKIAVALDKALHRCTIPSKCNTVDGMYARIKESNEWKADIHVAIHTNAHNGKTTGTRLFCYKLNGEGYKVCAAVMKALAPITPGTSDNIQAWPQLAEVNGTAATCCYIEVDFHDVPNVATWIISHTTEIAEAICKGLCEYAGVKYIEEDIVDMSKDELIKLIDERIEKALVGNGTAPSDWAKKELAEAVSAGITDGSRPRGYATREEAAIMIKRAMK